jgi:heme/copper-type cytochrome/quinol oxidase subunit 1
MTGALAFPALAAGAADGQSDPALHDTYYVVAHGPYLGAMAVTALAILGAWVLIRKLHPDINRRLARGVLVFFVTGVVLSLLAMLYVEWRFRDLGPQDTDPLALAESLVWVNRVSEIGAYAAALAVIATIMALLWAAARRLRGQV